MSLVAPGLAESGSLDSAIRDPVPGPGTYEISDGESSQAPQVPAHVQPKMGKGVMVIVSETALFDITCVRH
jgi:hypothetical protein